MKTLLQRISITAALMLSILSLAGPVAAAPLTTRYVVLSSSAANAVADYTAHFTTATQATIGSIKFEFCTTATGSCTTPVGLVTTSATLGAQTGDPGFSMVNTSNGAPYINGGTTLVNAGTALSYVLSGITNPTADNTAFYIRISTYTGNDGATGLIDSGTVAVSTATALSFTGVTPEILIFCVGTSITTDCSSVSGNNINFGQFSPLATSTGTSVMQASTNAANGYTVSVNGTTLASGANTIPGMASTAASATGTSQFGFNLRTNTIPSQGANPGGAGIGNFVANYGTINQYRFNDGETVATAAGPSDPNTFTSSYIVNIKGSQAAGVYTTTLTYVCTASF
jgi:hypothetical protein